MNKARIFQPSKTAMQSGRAKTRKWILEFEPAAPKNIDNLMGWTGCQDTTEQLHLWFDSKESAVKYAETKGIPYSVQEHKPQVNPPKTYAENFSFYRVKT